MKRAWQRMTGRQRFLSLIMLVLGVLLVLRYGNVPWNDLPLPANIENAEKRYRKLQDRLAKLEEKERLRASEFARLRQRAAPFWQVQGRAPAEEVRAEFQRLAKKVDVKYQQLGVAQTKALPELDHVREVEFSIRLTASMREVTRLLYEMEKAQPVFYWGRCTIKPDNRTRPKAVTLAGHIKALVLTAEATEFLAVPAEEETKEEPERG